MNTATTTNDMPEDDLRCEYCIRIYGRFVEVVCLQGGFDLPLALSNRGYLNGGFYTTCISRMLDEFVAGMVGAAFHDFGEKKEANHEPAPGSTGHPVEPSKPLHEEVRQDDLRLESVIKVFGRSVEVVSQSGDFTMPDALSTSLFGTEFQRLLQTLAIIPARMKIKEFFNQREESHGEEERQQARETLVDEQAWNFGSENLARALEQEPPVERQVA